MQIEISENEKNYFFNYFKMLVWPSGLRRWTQVPLDVYPRRFEPCSQQLF